MTEKNEKGAPDYPKPQAGESRPTGEEAGGRKRKARRSQPRPDEGRKKPGGSRAKKAAPGTKVREP